MGVDIETGSMASPQRYILQADNGVRNDGYTQMYALGHSLSVESAWFIAGEQRESLLELSQLKALKPVLTRSLMPAQTA